MAGACDLEMLASISTEGVGICRIQIVFAVIARLYVESAYDGGVMLICTSILRGLKSIEYKYEVNVQCGRGLCRWRKH